MYSPRQEKQNQTYQTPHAQKDEGRTTTHIIILPYEVRKALLHYALHYHKKGTLIKISLLPLL